MGDRKPKGWDGLKKDFLFRMMSSKLPLANLMSMKTFICMIFIALLPTVSTAKDSDGDVLPDDLELQIGTSISMRDSDGDGGSDFDELRLECDPTDAKQKIISLGEWKKSHKSLNTEYRTSTLSYDGKIVEKTINSQIFGSIEHTQYFFSLRSKNNAKKNKEAAKKHAGELKVYFAEREKYLELSPNYEEIKRLRSENSKLMKIYESNKNKENLDAWNKVRLAYVELEKKEYEDVKLRIAAARYAPRNRMEELEDRVEELEDEVDALRNE